MTERFRQLVAEYWDPGIALLVAAPIGVLGLLGIVSEQWTLSAVLSVLAVLALSTVKDRLRSTAHGDQFEQLGDRFEQLTEKIDDLTRHLQAEREIWTESPPALGRRLQQGCRDTGLWRFRGGTGTYLRAETLPGLQRDRRTHVTVGIEIIAPDDDKLCDAYAAYRRRLGGGNDWTRERVKILGYATVIAAVWYSEHTMVRAQISLSPTMSTFRFDLTNEFVIVTNQDPEGRCLVARAGSNFYASIVDELDISLGQARRLGLDKAKRKLPKLFTSDDVAAALRAVDGLRPDGDFLTSERCRLIAGEAISRSHASELGFAGGSAINPYPRARGQEG